jgi:hypothetical protein
MRGMGQTCHWCGIRNRRCRLYYGNASGRFRKANVCNWLARWSAWFGGCSKFLHSILIPCVDCIVYGRDVVIFCTLLIAASVSCFAWDWLSMQNMKLAICYLDKLALVLYEARKTSMILNQVLLDCKSFIHFSTLRQLSMLHRKSILTLSIASSIQHLSWKTPKKSRRLIYSRKKFECRPLNKLLSMPSIESWSFYNGLFCSNEFKSQSRVIVGLMTFSLCDIVDYAWLVSKLPYIWFGIVLGYNTELNSQIDLFRRLIMVNVSWSIGEDKTPHLLVACQPLFPYIKFALPPHHPSKPNYAAKWLKSPTSTRL